MKKLLGILGTILIAGSGMAGLIGNAPSPAKNEISSLQTNNLETLNRVKRQRQDNYYASGQQTFDINQIFSVKNFYIDKPNRLLNGNWLPSSSAVVRGLLFANPQAGGKIRTAVSAQWITNNSATIVTLPNTPFYGSFNVYY